MRVDETPDSCRFRFACADQLTPDMRLIDLCPFFED
jgi:hypothetical protein